MRSELWMVALLFASGCMRFTMLQNTCGRQSMNRILGFFPVNFSDIVSKTELRIAQLRQNFTYLYNKFMIFRLTRRMKCDYNVLLLLILQIQVSLH